LIVIRPITGKKLSCSTRGHVIITDRVSEDGGSNSGCTSGELLLMAAGSCAMGSLRKALSECSLAPDEILRWNSCLRQSAVPAGPDVGAVRYGRIPGARHLHHLDLLNADKSFKSPTEVAQLPAIGDVEAKEKVITYCRMSHRATVLYFALTQLLGLNQIQVYDGSWTEWGNLVGVPVER
jgi:rhodanese-related sulfurtransferase